MKASDLKRVVVMLEASPTYLAQRMKLLESHLAGGQKMVLTTSPTARAEQWKAVAHVAEVRLWLRRRSRRSNAVRTSTGQAVQARLVALLPFFAMPSAPAVPRTDTATERQVHRRYEGAIYYYQMARPSNEELAVSSAHPVEKLFYLQGKQDASYWSRFDRLSAGELCGGHRFLCNRTLQGVPNSPWTFGAQYNLGRTCEARGDTGESHSPCTRTTSVARLLWRRAAGQVAEEPWRKEPAQEKAAGG